MLGKKAELAPGKADGGHRAYGATGPDNPMFQTSVYSSLLVVTDVACALLKKAGILATYFALPIQVAKNRKAIASNGKCQ